MCLACFMNQHQDCPVNFLDGGKTAKCECQNPQCVSEREAKEPSPKPTTLQDKSQLSDAPFVVSGA